jgi:mRNA-degrading endonuclease HigB of HigAB toxin-antitoxin module
MALGITINTSEKEVFDSPSRLARLVAAFFDFVAEGYEEIWYVFSISGDCLKLTWADDPGIS